MSKKKYVSELECLIAYVARRLEQNGRYGLLAGHLTPYAVRKLLLACRRFNMDIKVDGDSICIKWKCEHGC